MIKVNVSGGQVLALMRLATVLTILGATVPVLAQHDHSDHATQPRSGTGERPTGRPAMREWTGQPLLIGRGERGERTSAQLAAHNLSTTKLTVHAPEGTPEQRAVEYPVGSDGARIASATPQIGNYHWVVAREESMDLIKVASTVWYFGNPGVSPKELLSLPKHELEIVPAPLPRERSRYREAEKWDFQVRFEGKPLPGQPIVMETEFGSRLAAVTDAHGVATLVFPRDFKPAPVTTGQRNEMRRAGQFVLTTEKAHDGRRYLTAFNYQYTQDPERNRSIAWGAAFGLFGMVAATPLLRRRKPDAEGGDAHA